MDKILITKKQFELLASLSYMSTIGNTSYIKISNFLRIQEGPSGDFFTMETVKEESVPKEVLKFLNSQNDE